MKIFNLKLLLIVTLTNILSCVNKNSTVQIRDTKQIILKNVNYRIKLSQIISDIRYIPLETQQLSLIGEIASIKILNSSLFIISKVGMQSVIKVFSMEGKYIKTFGTYGRGANEIYLPIDIIESESLFFVLDNSGVHSYSKDGTYLKKMFVNKYPGRSFFFENNYFYLLHGLNKPGLISKIDLKGKLIHTFNPYNFYIGATESDKIIKIQNDYRIFTYFCDTIYNLHKDNLSPIYHVVSKGVKTDAVSIRENLNLNPYEMSKILNSTESASIYKYNENDHYLYLNYFYKGKKISYVLNKNTNKNIYFSDFINDIDDGYFGEPLFITNDDYLYIPLYSFDLLEYYNKYIEKNGENDKLLWNIVKKMNVEDNPILMVCKIIL